MKFINNWYLPEEDTHFEKYLSQSKNYQFVQRLNSLKFVNSFKLLNISLSADSTSTLEKL